MVVDGDQSDSADIFWPGYVDAISNLVLNLLFLLLILIIAVFMFALELGRIKAAPTGAGASPPPSMNKPFALAGIEPNTMEAEGSLAIRVQVLQKQVEELKKKEAEAESLKKQLEEVKKSAVYKNQLIAPQKVVNAKTPLAKPDKGLDASDGSGGGVIVKFTDDAIVLSNDEITTVKANLDSIVSKGGAKIIVEVPAGFSEAKRIGFYRAMAVRNLLIQMALPVANIDVSVVEGKVTADNSRVLVQAK